MHLDPDGVADFFSPVTSGALLRNASGTGLLYKALNQPTDPSFLQTTYY